MCSRPIFGGINKTLIDDLWHGTGCTLPTPHWGYAYWSSQPEYGVKDMLTYCKHAAAGEDDKWAECARVASRGSAGLPVGVQVAALPFRDELCLRVMKDLERALGRGCPDPGEV